MQFTATLAMVLALLSVGRSRPADDRLAPLDSAAFRGPNLRQLIRLETPWGSYWQFAGSDHPRGVLVVIHGSLGPSETAAQSAEKFLQRWVNFARQHELLVLAPAFDEENYQTAFGGYRGLFGRRIGADEFLNRIVDRYRAALPDWDGRFDLYGHSAGAQFAGRYAVRHPQRLRAVVLSAPGRYAYPDPNTPWPYGMGRLVRELNWGNGDVQTVDLQPDPAGWTAASCLPITIVVGAGDTEPQPARPGHIGRTRIDLARSWTAAMRRLIEDQDKSHITVEVVPGVGHSSKHLTPASRQALERIWRVQPPRGAPGRPPTTTAPTPSTMPAAPTSRADEKEIVSLADDLKIEPLAHGVWRCISYKDLPQFGHTPANALVVVGGDEATLVNTPWTDEQTAQLCNWVSQKLHARVTTVIVTHSHEDCMGGLAETHRRGIKSYALDKTANLARSRGDEVPQNVFTGSRDLTVGSRLFELRFLGAGHTPDNIVVWLPNEKILFGGCLVKSANADSLGYTAEADLTAWPATIRSVQKQYGEARLVIPGHGEAGGLNLLSHTLELLQKKAGT